MIVLPNTSSVSQERSHPSSVSLIKRNIHLFLGRMWTFISLSSHASIQFIRRINRASLPIFKASQTTLPPSSFKIEQIQPSINKHSPKIEQQEAEFLPPSYSPKNEENEPSNGELLRQSPIKSSSSIPLPKDQSSFILPHASPTLRIPPDFITPLDWILPPQSPKDSALSSIHSSPESTSPRSPLVSHPVPPISNLHLILQSQTQSPLLSDHSSRSPIIDSDSELTDDFSDESPRSTRSSQSATSSDFDDEIEELTAIEDDLLETCLIKTYLEEYDTLEDALEAADIYDAERQQSIELENANGSCILIWKGPITYVGDLQGGQLHGNGQFYQGLPRDPNKKLLFEGTFENNRFIAGWMNYQNERIYESTSFNEGELTTNQGTLRFKLKGTAVEYRGNIQNGLPHGNGKILHHSKNGSEVIEEGTYQEGCLTQGIRKESTEKANHAVISTYYEGSFKNGFRDGEGILRKVHYFCRGEEACTLTIEIEASYEQEKENLSDQVNLFWDDGASGVLYLDDSSHAEITLTNGYIYTLYPASLVDFFDVAFITGKGILRSPDGDQYEGNFKNAYMDGEGTITYADGRIEKGLFRENQLIKSAD